MRWIEADIKTTSAGVFAIEGILEGCGVSGWQVIDYEEMRAFLESNPAKWDYIDDCVFSNSPGHVVIKFFAEDSMEGEAIVGKVRGCIEGSEDAPANEDIAPASISMKYADDKDWLDGWKKYYKPFRVGERIIIVPAWEDYSHKDGKDGLIVRLDPGNAFGTGQHESTQICITAMERYIKPGHMMLDLGCGSGILSVIGLMLGAEGCVAADINPDSAGLTLRNAGLNGIQQDRLSVRIGDFINGRQFSRRLMSGVYDCIAANIVADAIISLSPRIAEMGCLRPGGVFISSGIIAERLDEVVSALKEAGFCIIEAERMGEWAGIVSK